MISSVEPDVANNQEPDVANNNRPSNNDLHPSLRIFFCGMCLLSLVVVLSYIPGFSSICSNDYQPALITGDVWDHEYHTYSGHFGWREVYIHQEDEEYKLKDVFDKDIYYAGRIYLGLSVASLFLYLTGVSVSMFTENRLCRTIPMIVSWLLLLAGVINYALNFKDSVIDDILKYEDVEYYWRFGLGLNANVMGLLLIPVINVMLCVV